MAAAWAVLMLGGMRTAIVLGRTLVWVSLAYRQHMLINVIAMNMMQMTVVKVIHMVSMLYCGMPTTCLVFVIMVRVFITT
ncbi:hypothetical protein [Pseudomonas brenneri]|uniref:hypothetical protein n=1 Tax=Pseudomonas brenneri TaxID=129817 RepID=UPI00157C836D|nr:hypothetical protein [Pseudomonas brenneri]